MSYIFYSFSNGTKENHKKEALLFHSYIKRNPVPRLPRGSLKGMYLSKFVSCQILILVTKSCAELLDAGFTNNGVYKILFNNSQVFDVYCDQSSRGGGNIKKTLPYYARNSLEKLLWRPMRLKKRSVLSHRHLLAQFSVKCRKSSWISFILLYFAAWLVLKACATFSTN